MNMQYTSAFLDTECFVRFDDGAPEAASPVAMQFHELRDLSFEHHFTSPQLDSKDVLVMAHGTTAWMARALRGGMVSLAFDWAMLDSGVLVAVSPAAVRSNLLLVDEQHHPLAESYQRIAVATLVHRLGWQDTVRSHLQRYGAGTRACGKLSDMTLGELARVAFPSRRNA